MKKRNLVLCGLLSLTLAAQLIIPASAGESASQAETELANGKMTEGASGREMGTPPEKPDGEMPKGGPGGEMGTPPEKPDGEMPKGGPGGEMGTPPEKADGEMPQGGPGGEMGTPPEKADGEMPEGGPGGEGGPGMGHSVENVEYTAVNEYDSGEAVLDGETIESTGTDENAVLVDGEDASVTVTNSTVTRSSEDSDSGNTSSFYGNAAALLATAGELKISDSVIESDSAGGAGAFAYGDGTVWISDCEITTKKGTSGGVHAAGGGTLYASNLTVSTEGGSSAAIRSDRGGGTMVIDGGTYTTSGIGSPAIYSTADISVHNAVLTAENSEAVCIEGLNTIRLFDCDLTGDMPADNEQNDVLWNVIVYQSMSGDSQEGNGTFEMVGGSVTAKNGGMFYTTNTESTFILNDVDITYADNSGFFLRCTGNANGRGWGQSGANGADCTFTGISQEMEGDVIWDQISQLEFYMTEGSTLTGAAVRDDTYSGGSGDGFCNLYIDGTSSWIVTGDSVLTSLCWMGTVIDEEGNPVSIVGSDGTVYVEGSSAYTVTVVTYTENADLSGASSVNSWEDFAVEFI